MPDRDASFLSGGSGSGSGLCGGGGSSLLVEEGGGGGSGGGGGAVGGLIMGGGGALGNGGGAGGANGGGGGMASGSGLSLDGVCRDFVRNVCKRGKRCRFRHPDVNSVTDAGVQKNEFIFCHDHQNKECVRSTCRFVHGSKEDEDHYKKSGELPLRLRGKVAARLGLSPTDLPHSRGEVPLCRDFLKEECQRGNKCKFRHVQKDFEYDPPALGGGGAGMMLGGGGVTGGGLGGGMGGGGGGLGGMTVGGFNSVGGGHHHPPQSLLGGVCGGGGVGGGACGALVGLVGGGSNMMGMAAGGGGCLSMGGGVSVGCLSAPPGGGSLLGPRRYESLNERGLGGARRYDGGGEPLFDGGLFDPAGGGHLEAGPPVDHLLATLKRRRMEGPCHYEVTTPTTITMMEYRFMEEENSLLRRRVDELKKQVSNLMATNEVLLEQNAQFRSQTKVMTLTSTPTPSGVEQNLVAPPMVAVSSYNHGIAQTHTTLSSVVSQRPPGDPSTVVVVGGPTAGAPQSNPNPCNPPLNPENLVNNPLSAALVQVAQTMVQTMGGGPPTVVSMAPPVVAVSVAPVAVSVSMAQGGITMSHAPMPGITMSHAPMPGITMSHAPTTPMVSYPIVSQSMRISALPH